MVSAGVAVRVRLDLEGRLAVKEREAREIEEEIGLREKRGERSKDK